MCRKNKKVFEEIRLGRRENMTKTAGACALEAIQKDEHTDYIELQREMQGGTNSSKSYEEEVWEAVRRGKEDSLIQGSFFVVVLYKKERLLQNIIRQYFFYRKTCPTPEYDQTVYLYHHEDDSLEFVWTIPNVASVMNLQRNKSILPEDQGWLISMSEAFQRGELDKLANKFNHQITSALKEKICLPRGASNE